MIGDGIPRTPTPLFLNEERLKQYFKTFQELHKLGLKVIDFSSFDDNLIKEYSLYKHKKFNKFLLFIKTILYLLKIKKMLEPDIDGIHNFVLLKKL